MTTPLMKLYEAMASGEKIAADKAPVTEAIEPEKVLEKAAAEAKTDQEKEAVKMALEYVKLGRAIAVETFTEAMVGGPEEAAKIAAEALGDPAETPASDKVAQAEDDDKAVESFLAEAGTPSEKTAEEKLAELKKEALRELITKLVGKVRSGAGAGKEKAMALLKAVAAKGGDAKKMLAGAVKGHGKAMAAAGAGAGVGSLATYLSMKRKQTA